jgi:hypothetical protein
MVNIVIMVNPTPGWVLSNTFYELVKLSIRFKHLTHPSNHFLEVNDYVTFCQYQCGIGILKSWHHDTQHNDTQHNDI